MTTGPFGPGGAAYLLEADPDRTVGVSVAFLAGYLWFKDIPPFVFYLLFLLIGLVAW